MKTLLLTAIATTALTHLHAQELSNADRETLLDRLEKIRETADSTADSRFRLAISAYRAAMASNAEAIDFYLKCEEKVNFADLGKDNSAFRDWKRKNSDKHSDENFRTALRQQLRWLILSLEAASTKTERSTLSVKASEAIDSILSQAPDFKRHQRILSSSVTGSIFAKAYDLTSIKVDNWPLSPIPIEAVYEKVIFPPLRTPETTDSLRSAWTKRISQELILLDEWSGKPNEKLKTGEHSPQYEKFLLDGLPKMQWEAEMDIYTAGDEKGAALRMLAHIEKNITHESAPKWAQDFAGLLQPEVSLAEDTEKAP